MAAALVLAVAEVAVTRITLENVPEIVASMLAITAALAVATRGQGRGAVVVAGALAVAAFLLAVDRVDVAARAWLVSAAIIAVSIVLLTWVARSSAARAPLAFAALLVVVTGVDAARAWGWRVQGETAERQDRNDLARLGAWAASALPAGTVLTPLDLDPDFQWQSGHPSWVSWRSGAAVMWAPSFHPQWSTRMREVAALRDPAARIAYACAHDISYVLEPGAPPENTTLLRREGRFALVAPRCAQR